MPPDHDNYLLREAITNIKAKDFNLARRYLERALVVTDDLDTCTWANYWMSQVTEDPLQKRKYLEDALANDPLHPESRRALAVLDGKLAPDEIVNPDALPVQSIEPQRTKADPFICPNCGARMVFDGDGRTLLCEHCSRSQAVQGVSSQLVEQDFILAMATARGHRAAVAIKTFNCRGCGAQFILPPQQISAVCAFCDSPHVVESTKELIEPDSIIPMGFNQRQAAILLVKWVEKNKIKAVNQIQVPRGLYTPAWIFDVVGTVPWNGVIYRKEQKIPVSGELNVSFDDLIVPGASRLAGLVTKIMSGFNSSNAMAYEPHYLAGWPAELYDLPLSDASLNARKLAVERTHVKIHAENGHVSDLSYTTSRLSVLSFKLVLVPLWYTILPHDGRNIVVVINGQTGNIHAEIPERGFRGLLKSVFGE